MADKQFEFERRQLTIPGQEWPASVTAGWEARPVGYAAFRPSDAQRRELLGPGVALYLVRDDVYVVVRFDPITEFAFGARIINKQDAVQLRTTTLQDDSAADLHADVLKFLRGKPALSNLLEILWQHKNEVVSYDSMQDYWPEPKIESTIKRNLGRLEKEVSGYDPTGQKVFLDWSHAGRWAELRVSEK